MAVCYYNMAKKILHIFKFRLFRIVFVVLIITGGILFYQHRQDTEDPTCKDCNLILISVDTLRPDHMGVYGYEKNTTPNIDKWAKKRKFCRVNSQEVGGQDAEQNT